MKCNKLCWWISRTAMILFRATNMMSPFQVLSTLCTPAVRWAYEGLEEQRTRRFLDGNGDNSNTVTGQYGYLLSMIRIRDNQECQLCLIYCGWKGDCVILKRSSGLHRSRRILWDQEEFLETMPDKFHKVEVAVTSPAGEDLFWEKKGLIPVFLHTIWTTTPASSTRIFSRLPASQDWRLEYENSLIMLVVRQVELEQEGAGMAQIIDVMDGLSQELVIYMLFCEQCLFSVISQEMFPRRTHGHG